MSKYPKPVLLSLAEVKVLDLIAGESGMECWFYVENIDWYESQTPENLLLAANAQLETDRLYYYRDLEANRRKSFRNGLWQLADGMTCYDDYGMSKAEIKTFEDLLIRFKIMKPEEAE